MKPAIIAGASVFAIGLVLFIVAALAGFSYWIGALIALVGLIALMVFVALEQKSQSPVPQAAPPSVDWDVPELRLISKATRTIKCPRCKTPTEVAEGDTPRCAACGFS